MRYQQPTQGDTVGFLQGDDKFFGIDMTRDRDKCAPGMIAFGQNTRLRTGTGKQRLGTQIPPDFNPSSGFGEIIGSGIFRDPNGREVLLVAPNGEDHTTVMAFERDPYDVDFSTTTNAATTQNVGNGIVEFCQSFDTLHMFRTPVRDNENLVWNGNTPSSDANRWQKTVLSANGLVKVPGAFMGEPWGDRLIFSCPLIPTVSPTGLGRDSWIVSDLYDYSSYDDVYQLIRTNSADSDIITAIKGNTQGAATIYKNKSIYIANDLGTYPFSVSQRKVSDLGSLGLHMPLEVGGDQIFLSQPNGFYRLSEVIQDRIVALPLPISEPIQRVIDQINWPFTTIWGCSAALDNYAFFGVCIGPGQQRPNCILVYNTQSRQWESAGDTWRDPSFAFNRLHALDFAGTRRLCAVDFLGGTIYLLYEGINDELKTGTFSVPFKMETRGYVGGNDPLQFTRFSRARVSISGWNPEVTVTALMDGVNEETVLTETPITKNNTRFYTHGAPTFDPNTDDARAPFREDYSTSDPDNFAFQDFEGLPEGEIDFILGTLFETLGDLQECTEAFMVRQNGRWGAIRVENNEGYVEVKGITMEGIAGVNSIRTAA